ncbi:putative type-1 restriction enzyme specificity protein MPN_089, partial [Candidatus Mycoplasma haematohominis]
GDLLIANASTAKTGIGKCCAYLSQEKIIIGKNITLIRHNQNGKYLSYALATTKSINQKEKFAVTGTVTGITIASIKKLKIPLPPLEIQEQISEILDVLRELVRELVRELETELKLRKKQYRYYLNKLISDVIEKGWGEYKTLGEIAIEIYRGNGITKSQVGSGKCPCILYGEIHTKHN